MINAIKPKNKPVMVECAATLYLDADEVDNSHVAERVLAEGYREQTERHVTIIGNSAGLAIKEALDKYSPEQKQQYLDIIKNLLNQLDWKFKPKDFYHIQKNGTFSGGGELFEERESYIRVIKMPGMEKLYKNINNLLDLKIPTQFPHITLFSRGERQNPLWYGIGISSKEKFKELNPIKI